MPVQNGVFLCMCTCTLECFLSNGIRYCIARNFVQEKIFTNFISCFVSKILSANFLNDYIEDTATFTTLVKLYSTKFFCKTKVDGLGEIFVQRKFSTIRYVLEL